MRVEEVAFAGTRGLLAADDAYVLYEAAAEPRLWRDYGCGHGVDADPQARLDRHAFLDEELRAP